jgi:flavin-dependent dehydrogenase
VLDGSPFTLPDQNAKPPLPAQVDLAVIGGGPSGSTLASLVAEQGHRVLVLEKDEHPRFHIGESLLPHNLPIFRRLGLDEQLKAIGVRKPGVDFTTDDEQEMTHEIRFSDALDMAEGCDHAYQVLRSDFDHMMFEHAGRRGAQLAMNVRVRSVDFDDEAWIELAVEHEGEMQAVKARFVVDASGRDCFLARRFDLQERNREHATAALYGHFRNVPRRDGEAAGNISIYWFDQGWIWMIPLPDGVMSVGAVCNPEYLRQRGRDVEGFFEATIQRNPHAWQRLSEGELISEITATGNYSYFSRRLDGERWLMVGDAGIFIDPVFSSGVYFGMHSAELGADVVLAELAGNRTEADRARRRFRRRIRRGVNELAWLIYRFPTPAMRRLFLSSQTVFNIKSAVISALAGDLYDNGRVRWRLRAFRLIFAVVSLIDLPATLRSRRQRLKNARVVFDRGH